MFKCSLLSSLTVSPMGPQIDTYKKVQKSNLPFATQGYGGKHLEFYTESADPVLRDLSKDMMILNDPKVALEKVRRGEMVYGGFATLFDAMIPLFFTDDFGEPEMTFCKQQEWSMVIYSGFFVRRSPLIKHFDKFLHSAIAHGLDLKWKRDIINSLLGHYDHTDKSNLTRLSLQNLQASFMLLILGLILSTLVWLVELIFHTKQRCIF